MKILVTGAAGFIGFHLSQRLLACGDEVVGVDNLNDYYDVGLKEARLGMLLGGQHRPPQPPNPGGSARGGVKHLVTDDCLAFVVATRLGLRAWMLPDLIGHLVGRGALKPEVAEGILQAIRPRYHRGVVEHSLVSLVADASDAPGR